jgi:hypothetical protein
VAEVAILATGRFAGEGFDDSRLDTLLLAMPVAWKGTLVQYAGRLHRLHPGKREVQVFDYADLQVPMLARMFAKRLRTYRAIGYSGDAEHGLARAVRPRPVHRCTQGGKFRRAADEQVQRPGRLRIRLQRALEVGRARQVVEVPAGWQGMPHRDVYLAGRASTGYPRCIWSPANIPGAAGLTQPQQIRRSPQRSSPAAAARGSAVLPLSRRPGSRSASLETGGLRSP